MSIPSKKLALLAIPAAAGGLVFAVLTRFSAKDSTPNPAPSAAGTTDKLHESKALEAELKRKPDHVPILFRLAELSREMGKPAEAVPHLRRILAQEPNNVEARLELGRALYDTGDVEGSLQETNRILQQNPDQVDALYNLGAIYANLNKDQVARQYWTRAVSSDPNSDSGRRAKESLQQLAKSAAPGQ